MAHTLRDAVNLSERSGRQIWVISRAGQWKRQLAAKPCKGCRLVARVIGKVVVRG